MNATPFSRSPIWNASPLSTYRTIMFPLPFQAHALNSVPASISQSKIPMILISRTFEVVTPESAEFGESDDAGFICQSEPVTFRELVELMRAHPIPSSYPCEGSRWDWLMSYSETNYRDASERTESLHYDKSNPPSRDKYWRKAMVIAGIRVS
jgi:hypothetical protein